MRPGNGLPRTSTTAVVAMMTESLTRWEADLLPTLIGRFDQIDVALRHCLDHDDEPTRTLLLYGALWGIVHQARVDEVLALGPAVIERWPDPAAPHGADAAATYAMGLLLGGRVEAARTVAAGALPHTGGLGAGGAEPAPGPRPRRPGRR